MKERISIDWRNRIIFILMIVMMGALFFSRALLSASIIAFAVVSFLHADPKQHLRNFFASPLLWGMSLLFFLPLLSGLWSDDKTEWGLIMLIKLPLFLLPLAFAGTIQFSKSQWEWLAFVFIFLVVAASAWSMFHYINNTAAVNEGYLRAKSLVTALENDHVRFSWLASIAILLAGWLSIKKQKERGTAFWLLAIAVVWLAVFLHILAARTGLISFYMILAGFILWLIIKKLKWKYGLILLLILLALPFIAYKTLPTFQNRVKYFLYDLEYFKKIEYLPGANDGVRVISIEAGWNVMQQQPVAGVGFGDVIGKTKEWYGQHYPEMIGADKIYPSSEYLMYGAGCGWPGLMIFILVMIIPFFASVKNKIVWWLLNTSVAFSLLFDPGLEVQFGVFIYSFIVLWCWKWTSVSA